MNRLIQLSEDELLTLIRQAVREEIKEFAKISLSEVNDHHLRQTKLLEDQQFDIPGLAACLQCSVMTVHNLKKEGSIPFYRLGRTIYFKKSEIDRSARVSKFIDGKSF